MKQSMSVKVGSRAYKKLERYKRLSGLSITRLIELAVERAGIDWEQNGIRIAHSGSDKAVAS